MTEYAQLETPEAVRAALDRNGNVQCRHPEYMPNWQQAASSLKPDHIAECLANRWEFRATVKFRAPLPADREDAS